jgi:hypothetical protein
MAKSKQRERDEARRLKHAVPARLSDSDSEEVFLSSEPGDSQYECVECLRFPHAQWCLVQTSPQDALTKTESPLPPADSSSAS